MRFLTKLYEEIESPLSDVIGHFLTMVSWLFAIFCTKHLMHLLSLDLKLIPFTNVSLEDWLSFMEIAAITALIGVGIWRSVRGRND